MDSETLYIIMYYYDIKSKVWRADVLDEDNNIIDYVVSYCEAAILEEIQELKTQYRILRVSKTSFYK